MKTPRNYFKPLAIGAPAPLREIPPRVERMIHFVPPHLEKVRAKVPQIAATVDVILGNLEDAIPADAKTLARRGFIEMANATDFAAMGVGLWTRINCLNSPWLMDDVSEIVEGVGNRLDVMMVPKVEAVVEASDQVNLIAREFRNAVIFKDPAKVKEALAAADAVLAPTLHGAMYCTLGAGRPK